MVDLALIGVVGELDAGCRAYAGGSLQGTDQLTDGKAKLQLFAPPCNNAKERPSSMTSSFAPFVEHHALGTSHMHGLRSGILLEDTFDVIVIGSGASGAVAAETFVRAGLRTLLLEEGARLKASAENAAVDADAVHALAGNDAQGWSSRGWPWSTRNLGGGTVFYGGASFRYTEFDFDPSERICVDGLPVEMAHQCRRSHSLLPGDGVKSFHRLFGIHGRTTGTQIFESPRGTSLGRCAPSGGTASSWPAMRFRRLHCCCAQSHPMRQVALAMSMNSSVAGFA